MLEGPILAGAMHMMHRMLSNYQAKTNRASMNHATPTTNIEMITEIANIRPVVDQAFPAALVLARSTVCDVRLAANLTI
jgi:hypothetical protein